MLADLTEHYAAAASTSAKPVQKIVARLLYTSFTRTQGIYLVLRLSDYVNTTL
ncbi:hypothetical protein AALP_AAs41788U000100 [Arabis alpina]|uniref:Uncharacterized protein n=1 Tax=Arabis alpina TaxID=50452 RepID=A0A087G3N8_ARAAL|nr:hypothetical protein AALP_AAs41788U000100 [Arabis alpina]